MKIVSFNINSIRARPHQVEALVKKHNPDAIGLQETKVHDDQFPHEYLGSAPYDGILVSMGIVGDHKFPGKYITTEHAQLLRFLDTVTQSQYFLNYSREIDVK